MAKSANLYDPDDIHYALSSLPREKTELFSLLCCIHNTMTDSMVSALAHDCLEKVFLSSKITDIGVQTLATAVQCSRSSKYKQLDTWEMIDPTEITTSNCMDLHEVTFLSSDITIKSVELIGEHCLQVRRMCLYDVQLEQDQHFADPAAFCLRILTAFTSGYSQLRRLELLHARWVSCEALRLWARHLQRQRQAGKKVLAELQSLHISMPYGAVDGEGTGIEEVQRLLRDGCGITVTISR